MKKSLFFVSTFFLTKTLIFFVPLVLADILSSQEFGMLEYSLAGLGMLLNSVISLGVIGAYPYFILKEKNHDIKNGFGLHPIFLTSFYLINIFLFNILNLYTIEVYMAANISYIIAAQQFYSTILKSDEKVNSSVVVDAGIYILIFVLISLHFFGSLNLELSVINNLLSTYAFILSVFGFIFYMTNSKIDMVKKYIQIIKFGIPILISSFFLFFLTVSGRIISTHIFDFETTGIYGYYFRLSAAVVLIYQVVSIRFFKDLYVKDSHILDKYYSYFIVFTFALSVILFFVSQYFVPYFSDFFATTFQENRLVYFIIVCHMTMWILSALLSSIVDREGLANQNNKFFLVIFLICAVIIIFTKNKLTLFSLSLLIYTIHFITCLSQIYTLKIKNITFKLTLKNVIILYSLSILLLLFIMFVYD